MSLSDLSRIQADTSGAAGVELALMAPTLILFAIGIVDVGALAYQRAEVAAAAHAGALYAIHNGGNTTNIQSAAQSATPLAVTATATTVYYCVSGSTLATAAGPTSSCGDGEGGGGGGSIAGTFVRVTATATYTPLISWGTLRFPTTMSANALVRVS
jgi:Flp pilus assembly protein TadG